MSIQDLTVSNNQRKNLLKAGLKEGFLVEGEEGELVVSVAEYRDYQNAKNKTPIEIILGDDILDLDAQFWVFS